MTVEWVAIAQVTGAQGVRGEVKVKPLTDFPERLAATGKVTAAIKGARREFEVECARPHARGRYVMKLRGVEDRDAAEALRGAVLEVPRDEAVPLPEGTYYVFDLIGMAVRDVDGNFLGTLSDVITAAGNDVYVVDSEAGAQILIPAVRHVVREVDVRARLVVVDPPPGLLEIYRG